MVVIREIFPKTNRGSVRERSPLAPNRPSGRKEQMDVVNEIASTFKSMLTRPYVFILIIALVLFVFNHGLTLSKGPLSVHCKKSETAFCKFVKQSPSKTLGVLTGIPIALDLPDHVRYPFVFAYSASVYLLDEIPYIAYVIILLIAHAFFKVRTVQARAVLVAIAIACYYFEAHNFLETRISFTKLHPSNDDPTESPGAACFVAQVYDQTKSRVLLLAKSAKTGFAEIRYDGKQLKYPAECSTEGCVYKGCALLNKYNREVSIGDMQVFNSMVGS